MDPILPIRKHLPHGQPSWLQENAGYFITICCLPRGANQLCRPDVAAAVFESVVFRQTRGDWYVHLILLMPDHIHALMTFPRDHESRAVIETWKGIVAKKAGVVWQRGYFDHRLRDCESWEGKATYIRLNPCRAGLVTEAEVWPYVWEPGKG